MKNLFTNRTFPLPGKKRGKYLLFSFLSVVILLIVWKIAAWYYANPFIVPSPVLTLRQTVETFLSEEFLSAIGATLLRGLVGFFIAFCLAVMIGIGAGISLGFDAFTRPFLVIIRSTPVISFILLALIWFKPENVPVFIGILTMFPILCFNIIDGIRSTNNELLEMAKVYGISKWTIIKDIHVPSLMPYLFTGLSNAAGFGWRAVIIGEVLSQPLYGVGTQMQLAQTYLKIPEVIAWTIVAVFTGYVFEMLIRILEKRIIFWHG